MAVLHKSSFFWWNGSISVTRREWKNCSVHCFMSIQAWSLPFKSIFCFWQFITLNLNKDHVVVVYRKVFSLYQQQHHLTTKRTPRYIYMQYSSVFLLPYWSVLSVIHTKFLWITSSAYLTTRKDLFLNNIFFYIFYVFFLRIDNIGVIHSLGIVEI